NFLDVGGGAKADKGATAFRIILAEPKAKAILINIFAGITRCDEVARGIFPAREEVKVNVPMVVPFAGSTGAERRQTIDEADIPNILRAATLLEAAEKAVKAARGVQA